MGPELSQKLTAAVDGMPAFPKSVQRILELTRDVHSTPKDLVDIIERDPVVTLKILKVVNSASFNPPKQVTSIGLSVVYLGFNTIKNLALSIAAIGMLPKNNAADFDVQQYLLHSLTTAGIAKQLALRVDDADPMDCFTAGLLHDFGKIVFAQFMPVEFKAALQFSKDTQGSLHEALQNSIGADHAVVGAMLAEKWHFAPHLIDTIRHQRIGKLKDADMVACVFAANQMSKKLQYGFAGNYKVEELPAAVQNRLGGDLDTLIASMGDLGTLFEEAQVFAKL